MKTEAVKKLRPRLLQGPWYRVVDLKYLEEALDAEHTTTMPSRFSCATLHAPAYPLLYLSANPVTALAEAQAIFGQIPALIIPSPGSWAVLTFSVELSAVVDLSDDAAQRDLETSSQELTGDWKGYAMRPAPGRSAPTHSLGAALHAVRSIEAFLTPSSCVPSTNNLVIFPDRLSTGSSVKFVDPRSNKTAQLRYG
jgi:RES domain-containing protein